MKAKHERVLRAIFENPVRANILWSDIEALLEALQAEIIYGGGSKVGISLNGVRAVFHKPHPRKETDKGAIRSMKRFLMEAGIRP